MPYLLPVCGGLSPGQTVHIKGIPYQGTSNTYFHIVLLAGNDAPFIFNPRFAADPYVYHNNYMGGVYDNDISVKSIFPFEIGRTFEVMFVVESDQYKVRKLLKNLNFVS